MSLWTTVKQELNESVDAMRKSLMAALDFTEDLTRKGKVKLEIQGCRSEVRAQMAELGGLIYELAIEKKSGEILEDERVKAILQRLVQLREQIAAHEAEAQKAAETKGQSASAGTTSSA